MGSTFIFDVDAIPRHALWLDPNANHDVELFLKSCRNEWKRLCTRVDLREYVWEDHEGFLCFLVINTHSDRCLQTLRLPRNHWALREDQLTGI